MATLRLIAVEGDGYISVTSIVRVEVVQRQYTGSYGVRFSGSFGTAMYPTVFTTVDDAKSFIVNLFGKSNVAQ